jgi:hypothetical protein
MPSPPPVQPLAVVVVVVVVEEVVVPLVELPQPIAMAAEMRAAIVKKAKAMQERKRMGLLLWQQIDLRLDKFRGPATRSKRRGLRGNDYDRH